jgi:hypothetical protein
VVRAAGGGGGRDGQTALGLPCGRRRSIYARFTANKADRLFILLPSPHESGILRRAGSIDGGPLAIQLLELPDLQPMLHYYLG